MLKWNFLACKTGPEDDPLEEHSFFNLHARFLGVEDIVQPEQEEEPIKVVPKDTRPSWTDSPAFATKAWRATSITMVHGTFEELLKDVHADTVNYWTVDPPFNILEEDAIETAALEKLIGYIDQLSTATAVGDIYCSRDGHGTTYHDWVERFKRSKRFEVKDKYYVRCTNKVSSGRGFQLPAMSTVQEVLFFGPKMGNAKDVHVNYEDPRVDWATNWMEEYVDCVMFNSCVVLTFVQREHAQG